MARPARSTTPRYAAVTARYFQSSPFSSRGWQTHDERRGWKTRTRAADGDIVPDKSGSSTSPLVRSEFDDFFVGYPTAMADMANSLSHLMEHFDSSLSPAMRFTSPRGRRVESIIPVDVVQSDEAFLLTAEMPGLSEGDVDIKVRDGVLTISGSKMDDKESKEAGEEGHTVVLKERRSRAFQRSFRVPKDVDEEEINAVMENGVLHVTLPRIAQAPTGRTIKVHKGEAGALPEAADAPNEGEAK